MTQTTKAVATVAALATCLGIWFTIWGRSPRSFGFVERFDGREIPFPITPTPGTERFLKGAEGESISYGFRGDPKLVEAAMVKELTSSGWIQSSIADTDDVFFRGDVHESSFRGMPTQELDDFSDFAFFESDRSTLSVPPDVTCVATITKKSNLAELWHRVTTNRRAIE